MRGLEVLRWRAKRAKRVIGWEGPSLEVAEERVVCRVERARGSLSRLW